MTPDFKITADSRDITDTIRDRLLEMRITDEAGIKSDTVEIGLDDRGGRIALPATGAKLAVWLGYRESGIARMGNYTVDEIGLSGPVETLTIRGRAADLRKGLKAPRSRSFDNITIADLVATVAGEHGYKPRVAETLAGINLAHVDQTEESDLHLLTRLAADHGAVAKPAGQILLFVPKGEAKSARGKHLPVVALTRGDLTRWDVTMAERGKYQSVSARWRDVRGGRDAQVTAGSGEPVYVLRRRYPDRDTAVAAARAKLAALTRGVSTIDLALPGDVRLAAEGKIDLSGVRSGVDGQWLITRATHIYEGRNGYQTELAGETPK